MSGIETLQALRRARIAIRAIIFTSFETDEDIYRAVVGAQGYLLKDAPQSEDDQSHSDRAQRQAIFSRRIAARLAKRMMRTNLTARGLEVLRMLARDYPTRAWARRSIRGNTVRNHVNSIIGKMEVSGPYPKLQPQPFTEALLKRTIERFLPNCSNGNPSRITANPEHTCFSSVAFIGR